MLHYQVERVYRTPLDGLEKNIDSLSCSKRHRAENERIYMYIQIWGNESRENRLILLNSREKRHHNRRGLAAAILSA
jgi:hypothetical protein